MCPDAVFQSSKKYWEYEVIYNDREIIPARYFGFPIGITVGYLIAIAISLIEADGYYSPCVPVLVSVMGNEINAVVLQTLLCGLLGAGFAACSVIWEIDNWSIVKQTGIYFIITSVIMMPIAYFMYWMEHSIAGVLSYFGIFVLIFALVWIIQFAIGKHNVRKMNENLRSVKENRD